MKEPNEPNERKRRHFSDDQKATIVRRHLGDKVPVSDLADEYQIQPSLIYLWIKQVLDQAERAFQPSPGKHGRPARDPKDQKIAVLEARVAQQQAKLVQKNEGHPRLPRTSSTGGLRGSLQPRAVTLGDRIPHPG
ncbi:MAG: transposase [Planctomycetota bacterium]